MPIAYSTPKSVSCSSRTTFSYDQSTHSFSQSATTGVVSVECYASVPSGAIINSAVFKCYINGATKHGGTTTINGSTVSSGNFEYTENLGQTYYSSHTFTFKNARISGTNSTTYQTRNFDDCRIEVDYTMPASGLTLDKSEMETSQTIKSTVSPNSSAFTHVLTYSIGNESTSVSLAAGEISHEFYVPANWVVQMPNAEYGTLKVKLDTLNSGTIIGSTTKTVRLNVPAQYVPTIEAFTAEMVPDEALSYITEYVQHHSSVKLDVINAAGAGGSSITAFNISGGGYSSDTQTCTFGKLENFGDLTFTATVTDSRGRTARKSVTIYVYQYSTPQIKNAEVFRCNAEGVKDSAGTYIMARATPVFSGINGQNEATAFAMVKPYQGNETFLMKALAPGVPNVLGEGTFSNTHTYRVQLSAVDNLGNSQYLNFIIPTDVVALNFIDGALGGGIGKYAEKEGVLEIAWDVEAKGKKLLTKDYCPYEVGDVYATKSTRHPAERWPGTVWTRIEAGRFLAAAGDGYALGSTGGAATVSLTAAQNGRHRHEGMQLASGAILRYTNTNTTIGSGGPGAFYGGEPSTIFTVNSGEGAPHENRPPYIAVNIWERTA